MKPSWIFLYIALLMLIPIVLTALLIKKDLAFLFWCIGVGSMLIAIIFRAEGE